MGMGCESVHEDFFLENADRCPNKLLAAEIFSRQSFCTSVVLPDIYKCVC